jgi:hypothetical protein
MLYQEHANDRLPKNLKDDVNNVSRTRRGPEDPSLVMLCCSTSRSYNNLQAYQDASHKASDVRRQHVRAKISPSGAL